MFAGWEREERCSVRPTPTADKELRLEDDSDGVEEFVMA